MATTPSIKVVIVMAVIFVALLLVLSFERMSFHHRADDDRARFRLRRLGLAVNQWVMEHDFRRFPPIANPTPGTAWNPDRLGSARAFLAPYLHGDMPMLQREDESDQSFYQRRLSSEITVDPRTGLAFWFNPQLREMRPSAISDLAPEASWYFRAQRDESGEWPYRQAGQPGSWVCVGELVQRQITDQDLQNMQQRLNQLERRNHGKPEEEWTHDLHYLRNEVRQLQLLHREHGEFVPESNTRVLTQMTLEAEVQFIDGETLSRQP